MVFVQTPLTLAGVLGVREVLMVLVARVPGAPWVQHHEYPGHPQHQHHRHPRHPARGDNHARREIRRFAGPARRPKFRRAPAGRRADAADLPTSPPQSPPSWQRDALPPA